MFLSQSANTTTRQKVIFWQPSDAVWLNVELCVPILKGIKRRLKVLYLVCCWRSNFLKASSSYIDRTLISLSHIMNQIFVPYLTQYFCSFTSLTIYKWTETYVWKIATVKHQVLNMSYFLLVQSMSQKTHIKRHPSVSSERVCKIFKGFLES